MHRPLVRLGRYDVEVGVDKESAPFCLSGRRGLARVAGDDARAAGCALADRRLQTDLRQFGRDILGRDPLAGARVVVAGVGAVDSDQVAAESNDLRLGLAGAQRPG